MTNNEPPILLRNIAFHKKMTLDLGFRTTNYLKVKHLGPNFKFEPTSSANLPASWRIQLFEMASFSPKELFSYFEAFLIMNYLFKKGNIREVW